MKAYGHINDDRYDVIVVGGGHAGIEASLAAARRGYHALLVTLDIGEIGRMPCNPAIGGLGKSHLVREIDVLGGEMALAIDTTGIQFRILNRKKGPAVRSPRAQADKAAYQKYMERTILTTERLEVREDEVTGLMVQADRGGNHRVTGVRTAEGLEIPGHSVILSSGTFLRGLMHVGECKTVGGREGAASVEGLSGELSSLGFRLQRLKTGTPPRLRRSTINFEALVAQDGDEDPQPFSFRTHSFRPHQMRCYLTSTNERTHGIIRQNLDRSPLYGGIIEGKGPRYCPSIEDKVVRFAGKSRHLIFLEPEGWDSPEVYVNGLSTSLPADVQEELVHSVPGLEEAELIRYGYAVEYDSVPSYQVKRTLESKLIDMLFLAGQVLGTSGYEEAAAQGLVAGINAVQKLNDKPPFILKRSEAYIGVLIDDLVTKQIDEPYRMFTSRAEHRLDLRCDNAESRLYRHADELSLMSAADIELLGQRVRFVDKARQELDAFQLHVPGGFERLTATELLRRPEMNMNTIFSLCPEGGALFRVLDRVFGGALADCTDGHLARAVLTQIENDVKYEGYIVKQNRWIRSQQHLDLLEIPQDLDFRAIMALSYESREKLARMQPATVGQAGRIDGVRAGDLAVLTVIIKKMREKRSTPFYNNPLADLAGASERNESPIVRRGFD